jgi:hypothetical protein
MKIPSCYDNNSHSYFTYFNNYAVLDWAPPILIFYNYLTISPNPNHIDHSQVILTDYGRGSAIIDLCSADSEFTHKRSNLSGVRKNKAADNFDSKSIKKQKSKNIIS